MQTIFRKSLIASAIALSMTGALWAAQDPGQTHGQSSTPAGTQENQPPAPHGPQAGANAKAQAEQAKPSGDAAWLASKRVSDITGMEVKNKDGDELGDVKRVVLDPGTNTVYAIVSVGGFLGIGDKLIPMELDQMTMRGKDLIAPTWASEDQIKTRPAYEAAKYRDLDKAQVLGDVMGSPAAAQGSQFSSFDKNHDGAISQAEVADSDMLTKNWKTIDADNNKQIARSEFSAFESGNQR